MNNVEEHAKNKNNIILIITIVAIVLLLIGGAYGYFKAKTDGQKSIPIKVTSNTLDSLMFTVTDSGGHLEGTEGFTPLNIILNEGTMSEDAIEDLGGYVFAYAKLIPANTPNNNITKNYYLSLYISQNNFVYSISPDKPEILMKVYKRESLASSYIEVTTLPDGTTRKTVTNKDNQTITGFDITTKTGLVNIANAKPISASTDANGEGTPKIDDWKVEIIFVNYSEIQNDNAGKKFNSNLIIQKDEIKILADHIMALPLQNEKGGAGLYYHNGTIKSGNTILDANDNSYRYAGANPDNYVCIGNEEQCNGSNKGNYMYRIIGVFDGKVKVIKATALPNPNDIPWNEEANKYAPGGEGNAPNTNKWEWTENGGGKATLNTYLNTTWYNSLGEIKNKIADHTWQIGGINWNNFDNKTVPEVYEEEISSNKLEEDNVLSSPTKIGLMYVSDYLYAAPKEKWTLCGRFDNDATKDYRSAYTEDWMYSRDMTWTISRCSYFSNNVFAVAGAGTFAVNSANNSDAVRPVFYLESDVTFSGGDGSSSNPYKLG